MSNNSIQTASIRVKGSKNPWNKNKPKKMGVGQKSVTQTQQNQTISKQNDNEHWPDLSLGATKNANTSSKKLSPSPKSVQSPIAINHFAGNYQKQCSSTPTVKYKSPKCFDDSKTEANGHHTVANPSPSIQKSEPKPLSEPIQSPNIPSSSRANDSLQTNSAMSLPTSDDAKNSVNDSNSRNTKTTKKKTKRNPNKQLKNPNTSETNTNNNALASPMNTTITNTAPLSTNTANHNTQSQNATNPQSNSESANIGNSQQQSIDSQSQQPQHPNQQQHHHQNGHFHLKQGHNHNNHNNYHRSQGNNYSRRSMRGRRRGRGRGGYNRNHYYNNNDDPNNQNYQRQYFRGGNRRRNPNNYSVGSFAPRHSRNHNKHHHQQQQQNHSNINNSNPPQNVTNLNNVTPNVHNLWNQTALNIPHVTNGMFMSPFLPIQPLAIPPTIPMNIPPQTQHKPNNNNTKDNSNSNEGQEQKSDTTTTTTSANGTTATTNTAATAATNVPTPTPTPATTTSATTTSPTTNSTATTATPSTQPFVPNIAFNPYLNPTLLSINLNMLGPHLFNPLSEPPERIDLLINQNQIPPQIPGEAELPMGPYFVIKVACVATGTAADDRAVGHIALIDWNLKTKANIFVKPKEKIVSYIEPLTNLNADLLEKYGLSLAEAVEIIKSELPKNSVIVGQNITMDLHRLGLKQKEDFLTFIDLRDLWRSWSEYYQSYTHYSLSHQAKCVLNDNSVNNQNHSAWNDATLSMKLFQYYMWCRYYNMALFHNKVNLLQTTKSEPSFSKRFPVYEGVQMQLSIRYKGVPFITSSAPKTEKKVDEEVENKSEENQSEKDKEKESEKKQAEEGKESEKNKETKVDGTDTTKDKEEAKEERESEENGKEKEKEKDANE